MFAFVTPAPLIVPPVHASAPLTVTALVPDRVPLPDSAREGVVRVPWVLLMLRVPPLIVSVPAFVTLPVRFAVPPVTCVSPVTA